MLDVVTLDEARELLARHFSAAVDARTEHAERVETVGLARACGRVAARDVLAREPLPPFDRSTVDGYALRAADSFGCSDAIPALLDRLAPVAMGADPLEPCRPGACVPIPTGGRLPAGADAVAMLEYAEDYGDGTVGVFKPVAPGENLVYAGDELAAGQTVCPAGTLIEPHHVGALAALGFCEVAVRARPRVGVLSSGDEIVDAARTPSRAQMRDVNGSLLQAAVRSCGCEPVPLGIVRDDPGVLESVVVRALGEKACDALLVSGGSSAGERDGTARAFARHGEVFVHGIAVKPGKPTIFADAAGRPLVGLPGHPVAAYLVFLELVRPLLLALAGRRDLSASVASWGPDAPRTVRAVLAEQLPSNHGRAELVPVALEPSGGAGAASVGACAMPAAHPVRAKSGLIALLAQTQGYVLVDRSCEGVPAGVEVDVRLYPNPC